MISVTTDLEIQEPGAIDLQTTVCSPDVDPDCLIIELTGGPIDGGGGSHGGPTPPPG